MVTDDPETPGPGNWEINLASIGKRTATGAGTGPRNRDGWSFTAVDADLNYGWGKSLQLKVDTPWNAAHTQDGWVNGSGTTQFGVKWRFFDDDVAGWAVSTYPQLGLPLDSSSVARGLTDPGKSFFLPIEATTHLGPLDIDLEAGRDFQQDSSSQWIAGVILAHTFSGNWQLMFETREQASAEGSSALIDLGARRELGNGLTLLAAAGREAGAQSSSRLSTLAYLGLQIRR